MPLQNSGAISFSQIKTELTSSSNSLRALSAAAGFSSPDAVSEFYGFSSGSAPSVTTYAVQQVSEYQFYVTGLISDDGGLSITEKGFYVGTNSASPTNNTKYSVGGGTYFGNWIYNLSQNTTYYVWTFATNSAGTTYGARVQATTIQAFTPVYKTLTDNRYNDITSVFTDTYNTINTYIQSYYFNPYRSSWETNQYDSIGAPWGSDWYASSAFGTRACTNGRNKFRIQMQTTEYQYGNAYLRVSPGNYSLSTGTFSNNSRTWSSSNLDIQYSNSTSKTNWAHGQVTNAGRPANLYFVEVEFDYA